MVNIKELNGARLRKDLGLKAVVKRWHNHNNHGGNFGFNLIRGDNDLEITGYHNVEGLVYILNIKPIYSGGGFPLINRDNHSTITYSDLITSMKSYMEGY